MMESPSDRRDDVFRVFRQYGFDLVGVAPADAAPDREAEYREWLERGFHGSMNYLESHAESKYNPPMLLSGAESVIVAALNYYQDGDNRVAAGKEDGPDDAARVSVYAWGRDYHKVISRRLKHIVRELQSTYPEATFRPFVDILPISERHYAEQAGIGFVGRNTLLITREFGSWVFLCGVITTLELEPTRPDAAAAGLRCPSGCTRCIDACPTGALFEPHRIDASRCISYLTIERSDVATPNSDAESEAEEASGTWAFGCDICQSVCPFNLKAKETQEADFLEWIAGPNVSIDEIEHIGNHKEFVDVFAGSPLMRAGYKGMKRNAGIARIHLAREDEPSATS